MLRAALFDLDGTLILTNIDFAAMKRDVLAVAAAHGHDAAPLAGRDSLAIVQHVAGALGAGGPRFREEALAAIVDHELASLARARAAEGAAETLAWLRARGVRVAIVTRNGRDAVTRLLAHFHMERDALLTRDDVERVKPDPSHLQAALDRLGAPADAALMVGDHAMDIAAARAASMAHAVAIAHEPYDERAFASAAPDAIVRSFAELRSLLERF